MVYNFGSSVEHSGYEGFTVKFPWSEWTGWVEWPTGLAGCLATQQSSVWMIRVAVQAPARLLSCISLMLP